MKRLVKRHEVVQPLDQSYRLIPLTQGQNAVVDVEDFDLLTALTWHARFNEPTGTFYAESNKPRPARGTIQMSRFILNCKPTEEADHINGDTLDNRKSNLRRCNTCQNRQNQKLRVTNTSGFKGVYPRGGKWCAAIMCRNERFHLGTFLSVEEAGKAYDAAAKMYHREFAYLNFPKD